MPDKPRKMSEILKEMMERPFRVPEASPSSEASHFALFFADVAWNECVGLGAERAGVDAKQEMHLIGMVRLGMEKEAIRFLKTAQDVAARGRNGSGDDEDDTHAWVLSGRFQRVDGTVLDE